MDNPSTILSPIISGLYYAIAGILTFFSMFGVYVLLRYGKDRVLSMVVSIVYSLFFLTLLSQSYTTLKSIF